MVLALLAALLIGGLLIWLVLSLDTSAPTTVPVRRCPLCSSILGPDETVFAQILTATPPQQVKIKGCPHCLPNYRGEAMRLETKN